VDLMTMVPDQPNELVLTESRTMRAGYIYAVQFASGVVKVGQTRRPKIRLADHAKAAQAHGQSVYETLISPPHTNYRSNEQGLIAFCAARWHLIAGREYFADGDMEQIVGFFGAATFTAQTITDELASLMVEVRDRATRGRQLDAAMPVADKILSAAKIPAQFPTQLGLGEAS
jgi:hypothetical protein